MAGYVPAGSTWKLWSDAGFPNSLTSPLTGNTLIYKVCDGTDLIDIECSLVLEDVERFIDTINGDQRNYFEQSVKVVSDIAPPDDDLQVFIRVYRRGDFNFPTVGNINDLDFTYFTNISVTIPQGSKVSNIAPVVNQTPFNIDYYIQTTPTETEYQSTFDIYAQQATPNCNPASPCTLEITGVTTTDPTFQGGTDGSIVVAISGETGTTQYSLNGGTPQVSNTFTGLGAGFYNIFAEDGPCYDSTGVTINDGEFRTSPFIVTEPNPYLASENPIITTLSTASNIGLPANSVSTFVFDAGIENNYKVVFNLTSPTDYTATFTAKDFPNRENYFTTTVLSNRTGIPLGVNTVEEVADSFAEAIGKDINLSRYYYVSVTNNIVTLTAKEQRASMDLSASNVDVLDETGAAATTGITLSLVTSGVDPYEGTLVDDYSLYSDIYVGDGELEFGEDLSGGTYQNFTTLELPFSNNNIHQFDASQVIKSFVNTPKIDLTFTGFTYITSMLRPMYVRYGEKYPLVANENTKKKRSKGETDYKWVINSALEWEDANDMGLYFTGTTASPTRGVNFLTNAPNPLDIQREQTNFLYFILPKDYPYPNMILRGDIDYYDGTSQNTIDFFTITSGSTNPGGVYALNVSYDTLGLAAYEASGNTKVKRIEFGVYGANGDIRYTKLRTYRFEIDEQPRKFGVSFLNKLGGYDTFDFIGIVENGINRVKKNYTIPREISNDGSSPQGFKNNATYDTKVTKKITLNSGWIDQEHFDWLIELMSSNNIYSYSEPNQNYLNVDGFKYTKSSLEDLYELEVNITLTIYENNVTV